MPKRDKNNLDEIDEASSAEEEFSEEELPGIDGEDQDGEDSPEMSGSDSLHGLIDYHFLEYSSYVIKERAIPDVDDGLKPVQRRIMHTLSLIDDGRMHKVANVVGATMQFHPHGDQSIGDALVVLANKEYYIDKQGNFGDIVTGTDAAAGRYIECRLSTLAKETLFNKDITEFVDSYDGRNQEPVRLPAKVPSLLMLGSDGIAVGMSTHIFSHNFRELLEAQIAILEGREFTIYPDFLQGGLMDVSEYDDGRGRICLRARLEADGDKKVVIKEIPATTTTISLLDSIEAAIKRGKLKISDIHNYTAGTVNIELVLPRGVYASEVIQQLYAYTDCQKYLKSDILVIADGHPQMMTVSEILRRNTDKLKSILKAELEIDLKRLEDRFHDRSLLRIFLENRLYKRIENCQSVEKIFAETRKGLEKFRDELRRDITDDDIEKLLQIPIRRISRFDIDRLKEELDSILKDMDQVHYHLEHLVEYAIAYIRNLLDKYGAAHARNTQIVSFNAVDRRAIARRDLKVYHDRINCFVGTAVKPSNKADSPLLCTEFDRLMLLRTDGTCKVIAVSDKEYVGQTKYVFVVDKDQVFSMLYRDKKEGTWYCKRFQLGQFILNREYNTIPEGCQIENLYTNTGVVIQLNLVANNRRSYNSVTVDFDSFPLRSREARGFKLTHYPVTDIEIVNKGVSKAEAAETDEQSQTDSEPAPLPPPAPAPAPAPEPAPAKTEAPADTKPVSPPKPTQPASPKPKATKPKAKPPAPKPKPTPEPAPAPEPTPEPAPAPEPTPVAGDAPQGYLDIVEGETSFEPPTAPDAATEQPKPAEHKPTVRLKRLIDEDTPFFLE